MITDIKFQDSANCFIVRVAGINNHDQKLILHKKVGDDFWNLIGGKLQFGESTVETLKREFLKRPP